MSNNKQPVEQKSALDIGDIYFVLFKRKWLILSFCLLGLLAAGALLIIRPPQYESEAKLYVQYVVDAKNPAATAGTGEDPAIRPTSSSGADIVLTEIEFLTSLDLAQQVVQRVGADKILARFGGGADTNAAAALVLKTLVAEPAPKTPSILHLSYQHPDQDVARTVLTEVIDAYIDKSAEQHRTIGISDEFLDQETGRLREQLQNTEKELAAAQSEAGIISSLEDTKKDLNDKYNQITSSLLDAGTQLAVRDADVSASTSSHSAAPVTNTNAQVQVPDNARDEYQTVCTVLARARAKYTDDMMRYPPGSDLLKESKDLVNGFEERKAKLEQQYPQLASLDLPSSGSAQVDASPAPGSDQPLRIVQLVAKTNYLAQQLADLREAQANLEQREPHINELRTRKEIQEKALDSFMASLEQSKQGASQNISGGIKITESPTPAAKKWSNKVKKLVGMALAGGIFGGIGLAFVIELVLDRTVKRPDEIEKKLHLPLFISIPDAHQNDPKPARVRPGNGHKLLPLANGALVPANGANGQGASETVAPWDRKHPLHRFYAGLRDRLIVNFEVRNLSHNPKLVGVTSCRKGAGVSSIAAGLAASLSETGDGNVLLVDMCGEQGAALHFQKGRPVADGVDAAVEIGFKGEAASGRSGPDADGEPAGDLPSPLSRRFAALMPKLKASEYDYIIFDMPPVSQTSMTPRLAGLMDMVLLVIESEKTHRESVQRATALLNESRAQVSTVLNKVKKYVPTQLQHGLPD
jgi:succinoglycan biosynthesis transport protein ExoP